MNKNYRKIFRENLKKAREIRGWTQVELAHKTGVAPTTISYMEQTGGCELFTAIRVTDALECSLDYLCGRKK